MKMMKSFLLIEVILNIIVTVVSSNGCTSSTFTFRRAEDYVVVIPSITGTNFSTLCQYLTTNSEGFVLGVVRSFYFEEKEVSLSIGKKTEKGAVMEHHEDGQIIRVPQQFPPNFELFQCITIDSVLNTVEVFVQGVKRTTLRYKNLSPIPGEELVIGGSKNPELPGYVGTMRNVMVWDRKLSENEIENIYKLKTCPEGDVMKVTLQDVIPHGLITAQEGCVKSEHQFSSKSTYSEYLEFNETMPTLKSATICAIVTTDSKGAVPGTVGSISLPEVMDVITSIGTTVGDMPTLKFIVQGQTKFIPTPLDGDKDYHFCMVINLRASEVLVYLDGELISAVQYKNLQPIQEGAKVIIGQRQTCFGGCFEAESALDGKIRDFMLWDRILSSDEIHEMVSSDSCPVGHIVDLTAEKIINHKS